MCCDLSFPQSRKHHDLYDFPICFLWVSGISGVLFALNLCFSIRLHQIAAGRHITRRQDIHYVCDRQLQRPFKMPIPDYGAAPLAKTFMLMRGLELFAMVCIVGLTANFVSEIVSTNVDPPREIVGTLVIVSTQPPCPHQQLLTFPDMLGCSLLPHQHSILLRTRQSRTLHHGRPRLRTPAGVRHRLSRPRQTTQLPQLHDRRQRRRSCKRTVRLSLRTELDVKHRYQWQYPRPRQLGRKHANQLFRDQNDLGTVCGTVYSLHMLDAHAPGTLGQGEASKSLSG